MYVKEKKLNLMKPGLMSLSSPTVEAIVASRSKNRIE